MTSFLVYTGNLYPHKNVNIAIEAAEKLEIPIKIICARSIFQNRLKKSKYVEFLNNVSDSQIKTLYQKAIAFIFPSRIEGFGLPGLEAMSVGLPVIAANSSCLPEVYGQSALFFDPDDVQDLIKKISLIMNDSSLRKDMIEKGYRQAKKYSWAKMAQQTWEIYQNALQ